MVTSEGAPSLVIAVLGLGLFANGLAATLRPQRGARTLATMSRFVWRLKPESSESKPSAHVTDARVIGLVMMAIGLVFVIVAILRAT